MKRLFLIFIYIPSVDLAKIICYIENSYRRVSRAIGLHTQQERSAGCAGKKETRFLKRLAIEINRVSEDESVSSA
ncbi:hypothetical protein QT972_11840 [Microcoleus sp. herbarium7]|uniref:hypothetical protein n=1 Tax=Microcoleus sp. herbarium7 TaxID=3055435 RepID=UPI002FD1679C